MRFPVFAAALVLLLGGPALAQQYGEPTAAQPKLPTQTITIQGHGGPVHTFTVELAVTPRQQQIGEMFRTDIPQGQGMLFDWGAPEEKAMWMKNCPVPEDMVFIDSSGTISSIAENTVPGSLAPVSSGGPARGTLELRGGETARLDIRVGDKVHGAFFK